jgi:hypothetical protein
MILKVTKVILSSLTVAALLLTPVLDANAKKGPKGPKGPMLEFDQYVTPNLDGELLFGDGNLNGFFTTGRKNGVEVGLRAKIRFPAPADPDSFISNGDGTYNLPAGAKSLAFGDRVTSLWSFDWSVNTDYLGTTTKKLSDFVYELGMDSDPSSKTDYTVFDNISPIYPFVPFWDHAMGDNSTTNATRIIDVTLGYGPLSLTTLNIAQNSWRYNFFTAIGTSLETFDPTVPGEYTIYLKVKDPGKGKTVAESRIIVLVSAP